MGVEAPPSEAVGDSPCSSAREPFGLLMHVFGDPEMAAIFSAASLVDSWLAAERALALAEAEVGLIDSEEADAITQAARPPAVDEGALWDSTRLVGYPILPLVRAVAAHLPKGRKGRVHYGATTQDIMDTGLALQLVRALGRLDQLVVELGDAVARLVHEHRDALMAARTHGQTAVPTTLGAKLASFLGELARHRHRLDGLRGRVAVVSLYGAGGTSAALGAETAGSVRRAFARHLGLGVAETSWHAARDSLAEFGMTCALLSATAARFANEVINLSRSEIGEVSEEGGHHYGASSTMPQKRNPIRSEVVVGMSIVAGALAAALPRTMVVPHERAAGEWQAEWHILPELAALAAGALLTSGQIAVGLDVHIERMRANLEADGGRMLAEAIMIGLSESMGREAAHDLVYEAAAETREGGDFLAALEHLARPDDAAHLAEVTSRVSYEKYLGEASRLCDQGLAAWRRATAEQREEDER